VLTVSYWVSLQIIGHSAHLKMVISLWLETLDSWI